MTSQRDEVLSGGTSLAGAAAGRAPEFEVVGGQPVELTPKEVALYEVGKNMITTAISTAGDFCKTMTGTSTGAIALYYALFTYIVPEKYNPEDQVSLILFAVPMKVLILLPPLLFLAAAGMFTFGLFTKIGDINLNLLEKASQPVGTSVEEVQASILKHRSRWGSFGLVTFLVGLAVAGLVVLHVASAVPRVEAKTQRAIVVRANGQVLCGDLVAGEAGKPLVLLPKGGSFPDNLLSITDVAQMHLADACP